MTRNLLLEPIPNGPDRSEVVQPAHRRATETAVRDGVVPPAGRDARARRGIPPHKPLTVFTMQPQHLDIGRVFARIFETYRDQAGLFLPVALAIFIPVAILSALAQGGVAASLVFGILAAVLTLIATYAYQGMVVETVRDIQDGVRDLSVGGLFRSVAPVLAPLIGASILAGLGIAVGFVLLVVPGLVLLTWWALVAPSIVLERTGAMGAFGRSRELVRGNGWQVFGVIAGILLLQIVVSFVVTAIVAVVANTPVGNAIASLITNTLIAPVTAIAAATMFLELRRLHGEAPLPAGAEPAGVAATGAAVPGDAHETSPREATPSDRPDALGGPGETEKPGSDRSTQVPPPQGDSPPPG
jgi:hypothetical protein